MSALSQSVPVKLEDSWGGFATNEGLLRLEGDTVILEFETKDGFFAARIAGIKHVHLPLADIESCRWHAGWFSAHLELSLRTLRVADGLPGASKGQVRFAIARPDRPKASALASEIDYILAQRVVSAVEAAAQRRLREPEPL